MRDKKIIICGGFAPSLLNFRWKLIERFASLRMKIVATASESDSAVTVRFNAAGHRYHPIALSRTGTSIFDDLRYFHSLVKLMRQESPEFVFCYTIKPVVFGTLAAKKAGVPKIYAMITGLGYAFTEGGGMKRRVLRAIVMFLMKRGLRNCRGVFFQNPDDEAEFRQRGLIFEDMPVFQVAGSGVDLKRFPFVRVNVDDQVPVKLLLIARMLKDKGIREFVEACRTFGAACDATIVGPFDPNPAALQMEEIEAWETEGLIRHVPGTDDVKSYLDDCHIYVLPSYREGTPRTVLEAMATGRPIITTDAPGCRETVPLTARGKRQKAAGELVMEGENGFLVRVRDAAALEQAMQRFIDEPELVARMGRRSREIAEEKYDVHKVNQVMIEAMGLNEATSN